MRLAHTICIGVLLPVLAFAGDASQKLDEARRAFYEAASKQETAYRKALGEAILKATRCEVFLLDFDIPHDKKKDTFFDYPSDDDHFPIRPYSAETKILKRRVLTADEFQRLKPSLVETVSVAENSGGALCHMPIHGLRVFDGDEMIFETSICYGCANFYVAYPLGGAGWVGLSAKDFDTVMEALMPIPESERKRFEEAHKPKKAPKK